MDYTRRCHLSWDNFVFPQYRVYAAQREYSSFRVLKLTYMLRNLPDKIAGQQGMPTRGDSYLAKKSTPLKI